MLRIAKYEETQDNCYEYIQKIFSICDIRVNVKQN